MSNLQMVKLGKRLNPYFPNNYWNIHSVHVVLLICLLQQSLLLEYFLIFQTLNVIASNKFIFTRISNNIRWLEVYIIRIIYSNIKFILKYIPFIYIVSLVHFCVLMINLSHSSLVQIDKHSTRFSNSDVTLLA